MRTVITAALSIGVIVTLSFQARGQLLSADAYQVTERGPHHNVWEKEEVVTLPGGGQERITHRYTELASGLNYLDERGQWQRSVEEFEITKDGYAVAQQGQHRVLISPLLNDAEGAVDLLTPDGKRMRSTIMGLSLYDRITGDNLLIAEITRSVGKQVAPNQILFEDCFDDIRASVRLTYERGAFHQDVILNESLDPTWLAANGFSPETTTLEIWTEFITSAQPRIAQRVVESVREPALREQMVAPDLIEEDLDFGHMKMPMGVAYAQGQSYEYPVGVSKRWVEIEGRQFLVESVSLKALMPWFASLPRWIPGEGAEPRVRTAQRRAPAPLLISPGTNTILTASLDRMEEPAVVLDYVTANGSLTNYTFKASETYYLSGTVNCYEDTVIEGGAVLKYAKANIDLAIYGPFECKTGPYRPAIFTAIDDDSVGASISGSTGTPTVGADYGWSGIRYNNPSDDADLHDLRFLYKNYGIMFYSEGDHSVRHSQFVKSDTGLYVDSSTVAAQNLLFNQVTNSAFVATWDSSIAAEHLTVHEAGALRQNNSFWPLTMTNSLLARITNWYGSFTSVDNVTNSDSSAFTTVGAGAHYLAGTTYHDQGTTNISPSLLADLSRMTTRSPVVYSNLTITTNLSLAPQPLADTGLPDLGYHYPELNYLVHDVTLTNAVLTLTDGVAVASYNDSGFLLDTGSSIVSEGTPTSPNRLLRYTSVQEQPEDIGTGVAFGLTANPYHQGATGPTGYYRFTEFMCPANGGYHLHNYSPQTYDSLEVRDCAFWSGINRINGTDGGSVDVQNSLFYRSTFESTTTASASVTVSNNLLFGLSFNVVQASNWELHDNAFEDCSFVTLFSSLTHSHNAYINCSTQLAPTNASDITLSSLAWESGPLGDWYLPSTSSLTNAGSANADEVGLYHYTTSTNQVKETNSVVDIGLHYIALDANGDPVDTDGDGLPDYVEDTDGDGVYTSATDLSDWQGTDGDGDGYPDAIELLMGSDPAVSTTNDNSTINLQLFTPSL